MTPSLFRSRTVRIHGHDVSYRMAGEGPTILLVHGIAGSSTTWKAVMPALAEHYTVIAPDLLGHGQSAKAGITAFHVVELPAIPCTKRMVGPSPAIR